MTSFGNIYKDSDFFTYVYYKKLGENHRMYNSEKESIVEFTDSEFKKLKLESTYKNITEHPTPLLIGNISYNAFMTKIKSIDESFYSELKKIDNPLEFRSVLENYLSEIKEDPNKYRVVYQGLFIKEDLESLVKQKEDFAKGIIQTQEAITNSDSLLIREKLEKELNEQIETLDLISKAFRFC